MRSEPTRSLRVSIFFSFQKSNFHDVSTQDRGCERETIAGKLQGSRHVAKAGKIPLSSLQPKELQPHQEEPCPPEPTPPASRGPGPNSREPWGWTHCQGGLGTDPLPGRPGDKPTARSSGDGTDPLPGNPGDGPTSHQDPGPEIEISSFWL